MENGDQSVLVHLIGHHELYLELATGAPSPVLVAHNGHAAWSVGEAISRALAKTQTLSVVGDAIRLQPEPALDWTTTKVLARLHRKGQTSALESARGFTLRGVRLPILAPVLAAQRSHADRAQRSLVLVSTGPTRDVPDRGSTTRTVAAAIVELLRRSSLGEGLEVQHIHHETNSPHHYEDLPVLVRNVNTVLASLRRRVVESHPHQWKRHWNVALSLSTGPTAVIAALAQGTGEFQPQLIHVADARRWPEGPEATPLAFEAVRLDSDVVRQHPPSDRATFAANPAVSLACEEMLCWQREFVAARPTRPAEALESDDDAEPYFWFRKGAQEVLAVLVVHDPASPGKLRTFRGVNLEVSLPTGSLCAERNAIGSAFAAFPTLERRHIAAVAVLSLSKSPRLGPCGACAEWLRKMAEANPDLRVITFADPSCERIFVDPVQ
ncbi:MAG: hypothetical protein Q8Q09_22175 [Deltaproteobacteria bacterium]|nr:hypothetical protein [Deltaproteobacteria bacterium]